MSLRETYSKLTTEQSFFAVPFDHYVRAPAHLLRRLHLSLLQHVMRKVSRFRLRAHTLKVETAACDTRNSYVIDVLVIRFKMKLMPFKCPETQVFVL